MTEHESPRSPEDQALYEASVWQVRLDEAPEHDASAFESWLQASPLNQWAWTQVADSAAVLKEHAELLPLRRAALARAERARRSREAPALWLPKLAAAALLFIMLGAGALGGLQLLAQQPQVYATEFGERRSIELEDGSRLTLDSATEVGVRFTDDTRRLELRRGQARFDVAHDPVRPFVVQAHDRIVVAVGTAFNIDVNGPGIVVTMIEGRVRVLNRDAPARGAPELTLVAGQQLSDAARLPPSVEVADVNRATAWERGQLDFANETLGSVVARMNRYTRDDIVVPDRDVAALRISGVVNTGDADSFTDLVTHYLPVDAVRLPTGETELRGRPE